MATQPSSPPRWIVLVVVIYLLVLFAIGFLYVSTKLLSFLPDTFGPIPVGVPWYGALGAVIISLAGIAFDHRTDWDASWNFWHLSRPLIGASMAIFAILIFKSGVLAVGGSATGGTLLYYVIAFVVGYREAIFREFIKRVADVILTPGGGAPPPAIKVLNPTTGSVAGGDTVTITGSGFTATTDVKFNSTPATFKVDSDSQITATTPPRAAGKVSVTVTTKTGSITGGEFTYVATPTVTGIHPTSGPASDETSVTITGTGFTGATAVKFGTIAASKISVDSDTQITVVSPQGAANTTVDVTVTTPGGTSATSSADKFNYT